MVSFKERFSNVKHAWNAFKEVERFEPQTQNYGYSNYGISPSRNRMTPSNEKTIIASIYNRIGIDAAAYALRHVKQDEKGRLIGVIKSGLNSCLTLSANVDQGARAFRQDVVMTLLDEGTIAIVPVDTSINPSLSGGYDIKTMRVGKIKEWFPRHVRVELYNDRNGQRQEIVLPKTNVAIVENPLYSVMNERNSTLQRLIRKMNLLDKNDEDIMSGRLDLIVQLPYVVKSESRRQQAEQRRKDIEFQLRGSQHGIAYTDGTEKVIQLNRPVENTLLQQVKELTEQLYAQLGITPEVMNGTADEKVILNYYNRTVYPILESIVEAMTSSFLTQTARTQGQAVAYTRAPFTLVPVASIAEIADKFTRNEIMTSNELRGVLGLEPSDDPKADQLRNSNMPDPNGGEQASQSPDQTQLFDELDQELNGIFDVLGVDPNA